MHWSALALGATLLLSGTDGLIVKDVREGTSPMAKAGQWVTVNYIGRLTDGKIFDTSIQKGREPFVFQLGAHKVIKGWDEGVAGMKVGGRRKLTIPPELAYGDRNIGDGLIPPHSTLIFVVEMLKISDTAPKETKK